MPMKKKKRLLSDLVDYLNGKLVTPQPRKSVEVHEAKHWQPMPREMARREAETASSGEIASQSAQEPPCEHPRSLVHAIGGCGERCSQCGKVLARQSQAVGFSRADLEKFQNNDAKMNSGTFQTARAGFRR
jgi:hypothetical protein